MVLGRRDGISRGKSATSIGGTPIIICSHNTFWPLPTAQSRMLAERLALDVQQELEESCLGGKTGVKFVERPWEPSLAAVEYLGPPSRSDAAVWARRSQAGLDGAVLFTSLHDTMVQGREYSFITAVECGEGSNGDTGLGALGAVSVSTAARTLCYRDCALAVVAAALVEPLSQARTRRIRLSSIQPRRVSRPVSACLIPGACPPGSYPGNRDNAAF